MAQTLPLRSDLLPTALKAVLADVGTSGFDPRHTVRCIGVATFRSQDSRDLACLLDVDAQVSGWSCLPEPLVCDDCVLPLDFEVNGANGVELLAVVAASPDTLPAWAVEAAKERGAVLRLVAVANLVGDRLENCRELLRYAKWRVSLSDRIRLLAALDHEGSMTLVECMSAVRNAADPIGVVAALALKRFVEIDLDTGPLGPETKVTRFRG